MHRVVNNFYVNKRINYVNKEGKKDEIFFKKPFTKCNFSYIINRHISRKIKYAAIAQSVECILGKDEVTSSNLVSSSKLKDRSNRGGFSFLRRPVAHPTRSVHLDLSLCR